MKKYIHDTKPVVAEIMERWLTELEALMNENVLLKGLLAMALKNEVNASFVEVAEHHQQHCINHDQAIALLRHDVTGLKEELPRVTSDASFIEWLAAFMALEKDMRKLKVEFVRMTTEFYQAIPH